MIRGTRTSWSTLIGTLVLFTADLPRVQAQAQDTLKPYFERFEAFHNAGKYGEAEQVARQALDLAERSFGQQPAVVAACLNNLGVACQSLGRYTEAENDFERSLALLAKSGDRASDRVARNLQNEAGLDLLLGRWDDAETAQTRVLVIQEGLYGPKDEQVVPALVGLARVVRLRGRFREAEALGQRALRIQETAASPDHLRMAEILGELAEVTALQGRPAEAEPLLKRAVSSWEQSRGRDHPDVARGLARLGQLAAALRRFDEAEVLGQQALALDEKVRGPADPSTLRDRRLLAAINIERGRLDRAEQLLVQIQAVLEKNRGAEHVETLSNLKEQAYVLYLEGHLDRAMRLLERVIEAEERTSVAPGDRANGYALRAAVAWKAGAHKEACNDLRAAMDLAELEPAHHAQAEPGQSLAFTELPAPHEAMLSHAAELGDVGLAFEAMERWRTRTMLEQVQRSGLDLLAGNTGEEVQALRQRERAVSSRIASLRRRLELAVEATGRSPDAKKAQTGELLQQLIEARAERHAAYRDMQSASPVYRLATSQNGQPISLGSAQTWMIQSHGLLLEYYVGESESFVVVVPSSGQKPSLERLSVGADDARLLDIEPGPLTAKRLQDLLVVRGPRLRARLSGPDPNGRTTRPLAAFWRILIPPDVRQAISEGKLEHLVVLLDGTLALIPFEALVVEEGPEPKYLLDVGPPIVYGPSATVLSNLAERRSAPAKPGREPVLAVGDPDYPAAQLESGDRGTALLSAQDRYRAAGGLLARLPYTGWEAQWVAKNFTDSAIKAVALLGPSATEAAVRAAAAGRRVLHLGCHGVAEQTSAYDFGALALAPGPHAATDSADDGILTLPELSALDLRGCELTILSACHTEESPSLDTDGTWILSRNFLVAGTRRVLASDWLVDDEAAASLMNTLSAELARAEPPNQPVDCATALQKAKRSVRQNSRWKRPYFWASLRLVGPW